MAKPLVLFVHGLGGDGRTTWGDFPTLLSTDQDIGDRIELGFYEYPTPLVRFFFFVESLKIQKLARALKTEIEYRYGQHQDVILVAHSMGGIICQRYLIDEMTAERKVPVRGIALYAAPTYGSDLAAWGALVSSRHRHLKQLGRESDLLELTRDQWSRAALNHGLREVCILGGQDAVIVDPDTRQKAELVADKGHINLVKPTSHSDLAYLILKRLLMETVVPPSGAKREKQSIDKNNVWPEVLFDMYRPEYEHHYCQRREDLVIAGNLNHQNIWAWGGSGFGKTAALMRALYQSGKKFELISLGHYVDNDPKTLLAAFGSSLQGNGEANDIDCNLAWPELIQAIARRFEEASIRGVEWILIEELPLSRPVEFQEFFSRLCALLVLYSRQNPNRRLSLCFSSIADPRIGFANMHRMAELLKVIHFQEWRKDDLRKLTEHMLCALGLQWGVLEIAELIEKSKGSPRYIKIFFGNYLSIKSYKTSIHGAFEECVAQTDSETFQ